MADYRIFDVETVPDYDVWTPPPPKYRPVPTKPEGSTYPGSVLGLVQEDVFPPPQAHKVVSISWVDLTRRDEKCYHHDGCYTKAGWSYSSPRAERGLLQSFHEAQRDEAIIVSWNGRQFDMPVICARSLKHGLKMDWFYGNRDMTYRYSELGHLDLMDWFSSYGAARNMKLDDMCRLIGLPGKAGEITGADVAGLYANGEKGDDMQRVADYCLSDSYQTALLFIRSRLLKGMISVAEYNRAVKSFAGVERRISTKCGPDFLDSISIQEPVP